MLPNIRIKPITSYPDYVYLQYMIPLINTRGVNDLLTNIARTMLAPQYLAL